MFLSLSSYLFEKRKKKRVRQQIDAHTVWKGVSNLFTIPKPVCRKERSPPYLALGALMTGDQTAP